MGWRRRLQEVVLAGGAFCFAGCGGGHRGHRLDGGLTQADAADAADTGSTVPGIPCGNANPDPCICGRPQASPEAKELCDATTACVAMGGEFRFTFTDSAGIHPAHCELDGGATAGDAGPPDGRAADGGPEDARHIDR
jgi:hypothetical protein